MVRLSALILLATAATFAQTPTGTPAQKAMTYTIPASDAGCPVSFFASRKGGLHAMTASDEKKLGPGQGLHLSLAHPSGPDIQSIEVTVYASSSKPRTLPLDGYSSDTISKTFTFERQPGEDSLTEADVWMNRVGSVRSADLIAVTFTNGTTWRPTEKSPKCRAVPSNFLLVGDAIATHNSK
jgi:hypothetical protein